MRFFSLAIALIFFVSCANTAETFMAEPLEGDYRVTGVNGNKISREEIIINFDPVGNRVSGITGCNNFSANYSQEGRHLDFSTPMNTRKYCPGKMEIERQILSSIERASGLEINGSDIIIFADKDEPLITLIKMK